MRPLAGTDSASQVQQALERARAYAAAGADGIFIPGLIDPQLIGRIVDQSPIPVNVMVTEGACSVAELTALGVARISFGPAPFVSTMSALEDAARSIFLQQW